MERVLVTEATGFVGRHLVAYLRGRGFWVRGVSTAGGPEPDEGAPESGGAANELEPADLRSREATIRALRGVGQVYMVGGALRRDRPGGAADGDLHDELAMVSNLVEAAVTHQVTRCLYVAPGCLHDPWGTGADPPAGGTGDDRACCAATRAALELLAGASRRDGLEVRVALLGNVYGPVRRPQDAHASMVHEIAMACAGSLPGHDGLIDVGRNRPTSFCYVDDCVDGIYRLMRSNHRQPLLLTGDERTSLRQVVAMLAKLSVRPLPVIASERVRSFSAPDGRGRLRAALGWTPSTALRSGLERLYRSAAAGAVAAGR